MTADQVSGFFDAGEGFVEGTIAAALVILWILSVALHLARPYMVRTTGKFTLRLGADLWWIIYVALRDLILLQVFLGRLHLPVPRCRDGPGPADHRWPGCRVRVRRAAYQAHDQGRRRLNGMRAQVVLIGLGASCTSRRTCSAPDDHAHGQHHRPGRADAR